MSIASKNTNRLLPLLAEKPVRNRGNLVYPPIKKSLMGARPVDQFKTNKVRNEDVQLVLKFLRESFDFEPTTTPADTVNKLRFKMASAENKIKRMKEQLKDHDVLLFDVQEELGLGSETNPVRTARSFRTFVRTSKERVTRLEKTIKGNEVLVKACKGLTGVSGLLAPDGLSDLITSSWSKQKHVISQLNNQIQKLREERPSESLDISPKGKRDEVMTGLAQLMDIDTTSTQASTIVDKMKVTFIDLKDMVKVKEDKIQELDHQLRIKSNKVHLHHDDTEIQNLCDREKTKTKRIVELQNEMDDMQTKNLELALDLQEAQDKRQTAENRVFDFENKIRYLEEDIEKKTSEIEDLLQRYEDSGEVVLDLHSDLDETKKNNASLEEQIKDIQTREFKKDEYILTLEKELANLKQKMDLDSLSEDDFMTSKTNQNALKLQKKAFDQELKNLRSNGQERDYYVLKLEQDIEKMQKEKDELYQEIQNSFLKEPKTNDLEDELNQEIGDLKEQKIELELKLKDAISRADQEIFESNSRVSEVQVQKIELDSKLKELREKYDEAKDRLLVLEEEFADLKSQRNEKDEENQRLSDEISKRDTNVKQLMTENQQLVSHSQELKESCSTINQEKDRLKILVTSLTQKRDRLTTQLESAAQDIQELKDQSLSTIEEGKRHQTNAQEFSKENAHLSKQLNELNQKYQELEESLSTERKEKDQNEDLLIQIKKAQQQYQDLKERFQSEIDGVTKTRKELTERAAKEKHDLLTELAEARKQLKAFQEKVKRFQKMSDDLGEKNYTLSTEIATATTDYKALKDELKTSKDESEKTITNLQEKNEALLSEITTVHKKYKDLQEKVEELKEENKNMVLETITTQGGKNKEVYDELIKSYQECKERGEALEKEKEEFQENVANWEKEKESNSSSPKKIPGAMEDLHERITDLQEEKLDLEEKLQTSAKELMALEEGLKSVKAEKEIQVSELQEENDFMIREIASLRDLCVELEESMESMAERNDQLKRVLSLTQEEKDDDLLEEVEKSFLRCQDLEDSLKRVELESQEASEVWNEEKKCLLEQLQDLQLAPKEAGSIPVENLEAIKKLEEHISELQQDREGLEENLRKAEKDNTELREKSASEIQELSVTSYKLEKENTDLFKRLGRCQTEYKEVKSRADEMQAATEELQEQIGKLQNEREELIENLQNSSKEQKDLAKLQDESSKLEKEKSNLAKQLESRQLVCLQFEEYLAAATEESERHMELAIKLKAENEDLSKQLNGVKDQNQKESNSLQALTPKIVENTGQHIEELQNIKKGLEQKLSKAEAESSKLVMKNQIINTRVKDLEKLVKETVDKNIKLEHELKDIEGQVSKLKEQSASLEKNLVDAEKRVTFTEDLKEKEMEDLKEKGMHALKEKENEIKKVRDQLEAKTAKFDMMEKERKDLQRKVSEMRKLKEVLEVKVADAETREKEMEDELEAMKAALNTAAVEHGLLTNVGDTLTVTDLCQSLDDMRQLNAHMKLEMNDLEKAKSNLEEILKTSDAYFKSGDSVEEKSIGARERNELKETIKDLRFQTYKQEQLIKKLRYEVSEFHEFLLKKRDAIFNDMPYVDRAVVMRIYSDVELKTIDAADLSSLPRTKVDGDDDEIGKGAFGKVFLRQYKGQAVAVKVPYISERVKDEDAKKRMIRIKAYHARTTMEALVHLSLADHPSFPKTIGVVEIDGAPSLVLEFLGDKETGDVFSLCQAIKHPSTSLTQKDWLGIITDVVNGMKAMHAKGLLHNDLKPNNVLLQWDYSDRRWHAFIIDMGKVSTQTVPLKHRHIPECDREQYKEGTMFQHLAPEYMLDQQPMSVQTDIFSMGKIIGRIEGKVMNNRILRELVAEMTNIKPRLRPPWKDIEKAVAKARKKCLS